LRFLVVDMEDGTLARAVAMIAFLAFSYKI
jgi:hypothetical protein